MKMTDKCLIHQTSGARDFRVSEYAWFRCATHGVDFVFVTYCDITRECRTPILCNDRRYDTEPQVDYP